MSQAGRVSLVALGVLVLSVGSCSSPADPPRIGDSEQALDTPTLELRNAFLRSRGGPDRTFWDVGMSVPSFGGLYLEGKDEETLVIVVQLADVSERAIAEAALPGLLDQLGQPHRPVRFEHVRYTFRELAAWAGTLGSIALPGMLTLDIDERLNVITIGVEDELAITTITLAAATAGVDDGALRIFIDEPITAAISLQGKYRPTKGGILVRRELLFGDCTLGFNAYRSINGFVTAAHCTQIMGGVQGTEFFQPGRYESELVGNETVDPNFWTGGGECPPDKLCRYSDSAFVQYSPYTLMHFSATAMTKYRCNLPTTHCSLEVLDPSTHWFYTRTWAPVPILGDYRFKVGSTTGHTQGQVTQTNFAAAPIGPTVPANTLLLGNYRIAAGGDIGDSGAAVFRMLPEGGPQAPVELSGIMWGSNSSNSSVVFSEIRNINGEIGPLTTHN
jgi:hypothetical protein